MQPNSAPFVVQMLPLVFFAFIFYFLLIKPQQKKQKEHREMIDGIKKNDQIVTNGGIHGTVVNIKDKTFVMRVDDNTKFEIDKTSITYIKKEKK